LLPSLVRIVEEIFLAHDKSFTVRDVALSKASRILRILFPYTLSSFPKEIVSTVRRLFSNAEVPSDARIDCSARRRKPVGASTGQDGPEIIEGPDYNNGVRDLDLDPLVGVHLLNSSRKISKALFQMARNSRTCLLRISSRRDTIR
jgi:hypothetical protein